MNKFTYKHYENCYFELGSYINGNLAVTIMNNELGPIATVTVNPDHMISRDSIAVKDYSENEGMLRWLLDIGYVEEPHQIIYSGWVTIPVCKLTEKGRKILSLEEGN